MNGSLRRGGHSISGLFLFLLIGFFAIMSITLVLSGMQIYRQVTLQADENVEKQLALSYLNNKVRAYDGSGAVFVDTRDGISMLCLRERLDDEDFETLIYAYEGELCEQFTYMDEDFDPELGDRIVEVQSVRFEQIGPNLLRVDVILTDGSEHTTHMVLHSRQAG